MPTAIILSRSNELGVATIKVIENTTNNKRFRLSFGTLLNSVMSELQSTWQNVHRSGLFETLNTGLSRKLIIVSAPAGFGKTTVVL